MSKITQAVNLVRNGAESDRLTGNIHIHKANNRFAAAALLGGLSVDWAVNGHGIAAGIAGGLAILSAGTATTNVATAVGYHNRSNVKTGVLAQYNIEKARKDDEGPPEGPGLTVA